MPIYEFECEKCGEQFEEMVGVNEDAPPCEACGAEQVHRLISRSSFQLKGSGWYVTDYKSSGSAGGGASESAGAGEASGSGSEGGGSGGGDTTGGESSSSSSGTSESKSGGDSSDAA